MRPIHTFPVLFLTFLSPVIAQGLVPGRALADAAAQALPPAAVPAPALIAPQPSELQESIVEEALHVDSADAPAIAKEIALESAELEDLRQAEEASKVQDAAGAANRAAGAAEGLGLESPIRDRVDGALGRGTVPHAAGGGRIALLPELDHDLARLQAEYDIPIDVNEAVVAYVRFFQSRAARGHFAKWLGRSHRYMEKYRGILREEGLPEDTVFVAMIESGFGNFAYSRAKASGPWQFIGATGKHFGLAQDFWVDERRDPEKSARAAARYFKELYKQTGDWRLSWAGYNAGVGRIFRARKQGYDNFWEMAAVPGRKVLRAETKGYVPKLMAAAIITKHPEAFGFEPDDIEPQAWTEYEEVIIPHATLLSVLARAAGVSEKDIIDLNPEIRRACTPPRPYRLKIPKAQAAVFAGSWPAMQSRVRMTFAGHVVRRGDTVSGVAARFGVPVQGILEMNGLASAKKLRVGSELLIPKPVGGSVASAHPPEAARRGERARRAGPERTPVSVEKVALAQSAKAPAPRTTLRIRAGDTLWSISQKYRVALGELCRWNGIKDPRSYKLLVGAQIVVFTGRG